ncbi:unnamed protein product [Medioppia subpectinata]|uniref:Protein CNPPD1 n=1 Tax=Medioppia subpectinata TaxID=1979941 RepID=A0A7R9KZY0_9ACAR|nr:unnamed protein product [Medioppia subpectinata]CAG2112761.1 unnamed protein product [Medioppia subpectinata]
MTIKMTANCVKSTKMSRHFNSMRNHSSLVERVRKSLYYGSIKCGSHETIDYPSMPLTEVTVELFEKTVTSGAEGLDVFDMTFAAQVSREACITPTSIMLSMIYLERLKAKNPEYLRRVSTCDLFLVSIMIASKFLFDDGEEDEVFNDEWANSANIDVKQLNRLEREFLNAINWSLFVDCETFLRQLSKVEALISVNQSNKRGANGMTYTELLSLFQYSKTRNKGDLLSAIVQSVSKLLVMSSMAYWAAVLALVASTAITKSLLEPNSQQTLGNQSLVANDSTLIYTMNPLRETLSEWSYDTSLCDERNAKIDHILYIANAKPYKKVTQNIDISSKRKVINICFDSRPKKHSFGYYSKY